MGHVGLIAGILLLAIGIGLGAWGAPYYMLDWGGALVMAGAVLASAGLICVLLGVVLRRMTKLREDVTALRAMTALLASQVPSPAWAEAAAPSASTAGEHPPTPSAASSPPAAIAVGTVAAGAAATTGLAMAAGGILAAVRDERGATDEHHEPAPVDAAPAAIVEPAPSAAPPVSDLTDHDRSALDSLLAELVVDAPPRPPAALPADVWSDAAHAVREADDRQAQDGVHDDDHDDDHDDAYDLADDRRFAEADAVTAPVLDPPVRADLFARVDQAVREITDADDAAAPAVDGRHLAVDDDELPSGASGAGDDGPPATVPTASDEGVVAAYTIGDTDYAMLADGRVRMSGPDGVREFPSMEDLRAHFAARRLT